jgi:hypothetical protein
LDILHIRSTEAVYQLVEQLKAACKKTSSPELLKQIESAVGVGGSALEILGAVRQTMIANRNEVERLLGPGGRRQIDEVIAFVDKAFGR